MDVGLDINNSSVLDNFGLNLSNQAAYDDAFCGSFFDMESIGLDDLSNSGAVSTQPVLGHASSDCDRTGNADTAQE